MTLTAIIIVVGMGVLLAVLIAVVVYAIMNDNKNDIGDHNND